MLVRISKPCTIFYLLRSVGEQSGYLGRLLACGSESGKLVLHRVHSCQIDSHVMVAASLMVGQPEAACHIGVAGSGSAEMNHSGEILLLLERNPADPSWPYGARDASIEQR